MFESLKSYQWAVEREIVTRLTGISGCDDMDVLIDRLTEINSDPGGHPKCPTYGHPKCSTPAAVI